MWKVRGFRNLQASEVEELLESHVEGLTEEDLDELVKSSLSDDEDNKDEEVVVQSKLNLANLNKRNIEILRVGLTPQGNITIQGGPERSSKENEAAIHH
ncbi:hypothetical protein Y1Q_0011306 [Alligator mississippiensis]|uniref:Uncharacterized protein n=1 Tax=Alligator mississippiensis TaxID=8496 RepID=A0A151N883_ALLMI|nr:hypothetical protein Y1Q_0011306 [Alligator mississippiensis]